MIPQSLEAVICLSVYQDGVIGSYPEDRLYAQDYYFQAGSLVEMQNEIRGGNKRSPPHDRSVQLGFDQGGGGSGGHDVGLDFLDHALLQHLNGSHYLRHIIVLDEPDGRLEGTLKESGQ